MTEAHKLAIEQEAINYWNVLYGKDYQPTRDSFNKGATFGYNLRNEEMENIMKLLEQLFKENVYLSTDQKNKIYTYKQLSDCKEQEWNDFKTKHGL